MVLDLERDNLLRENDLTIRFITNQQTKTNISKSLDTWLSNLPFQRFKHKLKASVLYKLAYEQGRGVTEISGAAKSNMLELYGEIRQLIRRNEMLVILKEF